MPQDNKRGFASDNNAGVHPDVLRALIDANSGHTIAYGEDLYTRQAVEKFKEILGEQISVYFVFLGTAANVLGLRALTDSFNAVICAETAHINVDECGAPERFTGCKLITVSSSDGKISTEEVKRHLQGFGFEHHAQPKVISITQPTELGTLYSVQEIKELADLAHQHNMYLHVDGARIANAVASSGSSLKEMITDTGVDVLSFGGTKNGLMYGEAIVFLKKNLDKNFKYYRKQGMQLASKMRYISAQFSAYFNDNLWLKNASHANKMAQLLAQKISDIKGITITQPVQANGVFAIIPKEIVPRLQEEFFFYTWNEHTNEVRWMTSWDTQETDIIAFTNLLQQLVN
ncbi:MAG: low specificity L-threonine aldolase [Bacteroidota bacterium]|nr:low specificity L-threonine aldolase [Bacteroidota bacterium]